MFWRLQDVSLADVQKRQTLYTVHDVWLNWKAYMLHMLHSKMTDADKTAFLSIQA